MKTRHIVSIIVLLWGLAVIQPVVAIRDRSEARMITDKRLAYMMVLAPDDNFLRVIAFDPFGEGEPVFVTDDSLDSFNPAVSADGHYMFFARGDLQAEDSNIQYYLLDLTCRPQCEPERLPDAVQDLQDIRWSPVANQFVGWIPDGSAWVFDVQTGTTTNIAEGAWNAFPSWSSDGQRIVISSDEFLPGDIVSDDVQVIEAYTGNFAESNSEHNKRTNLTYGRDYIEEVHPAYSYDGAWIAYTTQHFLSDPIDPFNQSPFALLAIDANCVEDTATCLGSRVPLSLRGHQVSEFAWSPDGTMIAYVDAGDNIQNNRLGDIWLVEMNSGNVRQLTDGGFARLAWSPASDALLYEVSTQETLNVHLYKLAEDEEIGPILEGFIFSANPYWAIRH